MAAVSVSQPVQSRASTSSRRYGATSNARLMTRKVVYSTSTSTSSRAIATNSTTCHASRGVSQRLFNTDTNLALRSTPHSTSTSSQTSRGVECRASEQPSPSGETPKNVIAGMDASRGFFGFVPFSELWVGRWAMMGFASGLFVELATGKGILKQVGIETPNKGIFILLAVLIGGGTLVGTGTTITKVLTGTMSDESIADYASFLGLKGERKALKAESDEMKKNGDFTSIQSMEEVEEARSSIETPADKFLGQDNINDIENTSSAMKSDDPFEQSLNATEIDSYARRSELAEEAYAKDVELTNGRWAMIGFATAIIVEAATGQGIIGQLIGYGKLSGLLGDMSGF